MQQSWRPFGSTYHVACMTHHCDRCNQLIQPGDRYERFVERRGERIMVWKHHDIPDCPPDPFKDDEEEAENDNEKVIIDELKRAA